LGNSCSGIRCCGSLGSDNSSGSSRRGSDDNVRGEGNSNSNSDSEVADSDREQKVGDNVIFQGPKWWCSGPKWWCSTRKGRL
jgi:hypothetical protein